MTVLYVLFGVLVAVILLLLFPVTLNLRYDGVLNATVSYLFFTFKIKKGEKNTKQPKKATEKNSSAEKNAEKKKKKKTHITSEMLSEYINAVSAIIKATGKLMRLVKIKRLGLFITVGGDDAASCAVKYGAVCAAVYPFLGILDSYADVKGKRVEITADYDSNTVRCDAATQISVIPVLGIAAVLGLVINAMKIHLKTTAVKEKSKNG